MYDAIVITTVLLSILVSILIYFLPTVVARGNHKLDTGAIFVLNLLTGWTFVGWVVALVWACKHDKASNLT